MKKIIKWVTIAGLVCSAALLLVHCASVNGLKNFAQCKFELKNVTNVNMAGVNVTNKNDIKKLSANDYAKFIKAISEKKLPLTFDVNVGVRNPNDKDARLDGLDYILWIDDIEATSGVMTQQVNIKSKESQDVKMPFQTDLYKLLSGKNATKIISFALDLATDNADKSRVKVSLKPFFTVAGKTVKFPSYITIGGDKLMPKSSK